LMVFPLTSWLFWWCLSCLSCVCVCVVPSFQNWFKIVPRMGLCCCPCWVVSGVVSLWCWCGYGWWARLGWVCHV
jgi:hypothetical protein